jgi:SagB-type dehydrogenase family enzyme
MWYSNIIPARNTTCTDSQHRWGIWTGRHNRIRSERLKVRRTVDLPLSARPISKAAYANFTPRKVLRPRRSIEKVSAPCSNWLSDYLPGSSSNKPAGLCDATHPAATFIPRKGYAIVPRLQGLDAGVYHYAPRDHRLEWRCMPERGGVERLAQMLPGVLLIGLSSIHWREAWKYGERAFRYCQHDIGHAIATVRYAAAALGWKARLLDVSDATIANVLGLAQGAGLFRH